MKKYYLYIIVVIGYFLVVAGSCSEEPNISGCTDSSACNYNIEATIDDDSCENEYDCANVCGGDSLIDDCGDCSSADNFNLNQDECGVCRGSGPNENLDCDGNCISPTDDGCKCSVLYDDCGFCGGDNSSCIDCNGDLNGDAFIDGCSDCVGGGTGIEPCKTDCNDVDDGSAFIDSCGVCVSDGDTSCIQGCDGYWVNDGSETLIDDCGICGGGNIDLDCAGQCNGLSFLDECGNCISNEISWLMQISVSTLPYDISALEVEDLDNYLGGAYNATDGFDGLEIDKIDALIHPPSNWVDFYFIHNDWTDAMAASCDGYCTKFMQDIRTNHHSDYFEGKSWRGELAANSPGTASLTINYLTNISDANIVVTIDGSVYENVNSNQPIEDIIFDDNGAIKKEIIIQISNLCY